MVAGDFTRQAEGDLYILEAGDDPAARPGGSLVAYCVAWLSAESNPPDLTLALANIGLNRPGVFLFLNASPTDILTVEAEFVAQLRQLLNDPAFGGTRFLWISPLLEDGSLRPLAAWSLYHLALRPDQRVRRLTFFDVQNYSLAIARNSRCTLDADTGTVALTDPGGLYFTSRYGSQRLRDVQNVEILLTGAQAGCLRFALTVSTPSGEPFEELTALDVGFKIFARDPSFSPDPDHFWVTAYRFPFISEDGEATRWFTPSLGQRQAEPPGDGQPEPRASLTLYATLDPLNPLHPPRTYFSLVDPSSGATQTEISSCYRTHLGYTLHLTPRSHGESRLILAENPVQSRRGSTDPFYLVPDGAFTLSVPPYEANATPDPEPSLQVRKRDKLLCGLAGIEYVQLTPSQDAAGTPTPVENILQVTAGYPAFAPDFIPDVPTAPDQASQRLEGDRATTAWAYVYAQNPEDEASRQSLTYFSQPKQALLYTTPRVQDRDTIASNNVFSFLEVPLTPLPLESELTSSSPPGPDPEPEPQAPAPPLPWFPMLPYGGVSGDLSHYAQLEEKLINPRRRSRIADLIKAQPEEPQVAAMVVGDGDMPETAAAAAPGEDRIGTTPQGLLATYAADFEILKTLLLAKDTDQEPLNFANIERRSPLRFAFQSNQLFLIITDPTLLQDHFPNNQITIQGWSFSLDPTDWRGQNDDGTPPDTHTVMIFKFFDKPLIEMLNETALWEQPEVFVSPNAVTVEQVRDRLVRAFEEAIAKSGPDASPKDRENYAPLANLARSKEWSGLVALNVPASGLPDELSALKCGIKDAQNFYARYVGSNGTPVVAQGDTLEAEESSLFGLLDYQDNSAPEVGESGLAFQVLSLRVQFQNSKIIGFSSELALTLDRLFGETTLLLNSRTGRNIVLLQGFTEEHNGEITYSFSFKGENYFALPDSHIFNTIDILKVEFSSDPPGADPNVSVARFTLWGRFNFKQLDGFDALSFGSSRTPSGDSPDLIEAVIQARQALNRSAPALETDFQQARDDQQAAQAALDTALATLAENQQFLRFAKLVIVMECKTPADPESGEDVGSETFTVDAGQLTFDLEKSQVRSHSLYAKFPLKLVSFTPITPENKPKGFLAVKSPLGTNKPPDQGYGLIYEMNMGNLGGLSGSAQFVAHVLIAWAPNPEKAQVSIGLKLPGIGGDVLGFPLQSVLKLSFKSVEFLVDRARPNNPGYLLKIKKIALKFFVLSFPPSGQTEIVIFGNPDAEGSNDAIGWYAAYAKEPTPPPEGQPQGRAARR